MIDKTIEFCGRVANGAGIEVEPTESIKKLRQISVVTNSVVGVGLFTVGILLSSKALATIGILGMTGAAVMGVCNSFGKERRNQRMTSNMTEPI